MAAYTNDLRLKEIATGDESGTWGASTNTNLELIAESFSFGTEAITTNADTHASTIADGSTDEARSLYLKYTGTLDSACTITIGPNTISKLWFIENATSGSQNIIIKQGSGATVTIANGQVKAIYSDGAGSGGAMVDAFQDLSVPDLFIDDDLSLQSDAAVINFGADADVNLTHVADTGLLLNSSRQLQFGDSGTYIHQSADGVLDLVSDTELELNATTIDINGAVDISGNCLVSGEVQTANIGFTDGDNAMTIADGGAVTFPQTAVFSSGLSAGDSNITNVGDIALDSISADGSSISIASPVVINGTTPSLTIGDAGAEDTSLVFDGNAKDFYLGLDDSADKLVLGVGSSVGTNNILTLDDDSVVIGDGAAVDTSIVFDGNAQDFYIALDDSADDLLIGNGSTVGSNIAIGINSSQVVKFNDAYTFPTSDGSANQVLQTDGSGALSFASASGTTINNNADNRLITGSGTANTLEGEANATWNGNTLALTAGAGNTGISLTDGSTNYGFIGGGNALKSGGSANDFSFRTDTGSIDFYTNGQNLRFSLESDGQINMTDNICMGTTSQRDNAVITAVKDGSNADAVLDMDHGTGDASFYRFIKFRKKNESSAVGRLDADITGSTMTLAFDSDGRYKDVLGDADGLNLISKLEPIKFMWKDGTGEGSQGFIAQDFKKAFDDVGSYARGVYEPEDESKEKWQLDYGTLVPNLVKAIQEQQEQIQVLQNEIQQLKGGS
tara:strand:- start:17148 stop:19346 length:2199 start_codon:yes stop_codon:yes gene_type:complete